MKPSFEQHIEPTSLELYALGQLDEARTEVLEEHILICEPCRVRLDEEDHYVRSMQGAAARLRQEAENAPASILDSVQNWFRMPMPAWGALAAAACLVVVVTTSQLKQTPVNDAAVTVELSAQRGDAGGKSGIGSAPANRKLDLKLDTRALTLPSSVHVQVVGADGSEKEDDVVSPTGDSLEVKTHERLAPGAYLVRLYQPKSTKLIREYSLNVR